MLAKAVMHEEQISTRLHMKIDKLIDLKHRNLVCIIQGYSTIRVLWTYSMVKCTNFVKRPVQTSTLIMLQNALPNTIRSPIHHYTRNIQDIVEYPLVTWGYLTRCLNGCGKHCSKSNSRLLAIFCETMIKCQQIMPILVYKNHT